MKLMELLNAEAISVSLAAKSKDEVISEMVDLLIASGEIKKADKPKILAKIREREALGSTGIGKGIGIPHAKCDSIKRMTASLGISKAGIDFKSLDGEPSYIFFLLVTPGDNPGPHLKALAKISRLLDDKFVRERLRTAKSNRELLSILKEEDQKSQ